MKYNVYGTGNALVDYLAFVDDDFLIRNNIPKGAMTLVDTPGTERILTNDKIQFERCSGGSTANTIVGIAKLGGNAAFTGKVTDDENGVFYKKDLEAVGIRFSSEIVSGTTGTCVSLITPDGQRSMLTHLGVSSDLTRSDINEKLIAESEFLYVEGYQWSAELARDASIYAMESAKKHDTNIALTYSDPLMAINFRDEFARITRDYVDLLFCNEDEAKAVSNTDTTHEAVKYLGALSRMICVTTGPHGAIVSDDGEVTVTPALLIKELVDTTGAGDMYAAGVLRGLCHGFDLVCSSMIGSRMAAAIVSQVGARLP